MIYPLKKVYVTQEHGVNEHIYKRFGYKGHNGLDLRLYRGNDTPVYAPHSGIIKERQNDKDGYGLYLKIESKKEGSILAHLKEFRVNINKEVKEGDLVAIGDNTGWSTGPHLHWGFYSHPRDRKNGYGGTIDPRPYLGTEPMFYKGIDLNNKESIKVCVDIWKDVADGKYAKKEEYQNLKEEYKREKEALDVRIDEEKKRYKEFVVKLAEKLGSQQNKPSILEEITRAIGLEEQVDKLGRKNKEHQRRLTSQGEEIKSLRLRLKTSSIKEISKFTGKELIIKGIIKIFGGGRRENGQS